MKLIKSIMPDGKYFLERTDGKQVFDNPFSYIETIHSTRAVVQKNGLSNIVDINGKYASNNWFEFYLYTSEDDIIIHVDNKGFNIITSNNKLLLGVWCYDICYSVYSPICVNIQLKKGEYYHTDYNGNLKYIND